MFYLTGAEEKILGEFRETYSPSALDFHLQAMIQSAGKLVLIDKLLPKMKAGGHKVLIFSQMVRCLDILEDYLIHKRYGTAHVADVRSELCGDVLTETLQLYRCLLFVLCLLKEA